MYLIYYSFLHLDSSFFTLRWTLKFLVFYDQDTIQCNQVIKMKSINLKEIIVGNNRPNSPAANLGGPFDIAKDEVNFKGNFNLPIGGQHDPMPRGHILFHSNMIAVHKSFRAKIYNLSIAQMFNVS